jgi:hypothetical protein
MFIDFIDGFAQGFSVPVVIVVGPNAVFPF